MKGIRMKSFPMQVLGLVLVSLLLPTTLAMAADATFRYYFDTAPTTLKDLDTLLSDLASDSERKVPDTPLVVMLHGDHANVFVRENYAANRKRVDQAALLDAYGIIDVKMCATWMRLNDIQASDIPPFIDTVPFGPGEVDRLRKNGYLETTRVKL